MGGRGNDPRAAEVAWKEVLGNLPCDDQRRESRLAPGRDDGVRRTQVIHRREVNASDLNRFDREPSIRCPLGRVP